MVGYWVVVFGEIGGLRWVLKHDKMAFTAARRSLASNIEPGDRLALYLGRGAYHNPTRDRSQVIGLATARTRVADLRKPIEIAAWEFVCACDLSIDIALPEREGVPIEPLIPKLSLVKRPEVWGQYFRRSLVALAKSDFRQFERAVMAATRDSLPPHVPPSPAPRVGAIDD